MMKNKTELNFNMSKSKAQNMIKKKINILKSSILKNKIKLIQKKIIKKEMDLFFYQVVLKNREKYLYSNNKFFILMILSMIINAVDNSIVYCNIEENLQEMAPKEPEPDIYIEESDESSEKREHLPRLNKQKPIIEQSIGSHNDNVNTNPALRQAQTMANNPNAGGFMLFECIFNAFSNCFSKK